MRHNLSRRRSRHTRQGHARFSRQGLSFGSSSASADELIHLVQQGIPFKMLTSMSAQTGIPTRELAVVLEIPERTLARRHVAGRLGRDESERFLRVARVVGKAVRLFEGNVGAAVAWLKTPQKALSYNTPLSYGRFEIGAQEVENLIGRLEHGVFS